jgi:hypothetical protein
VVVLVLMPRAEVDETVGRFVVVVRDVIMAVAVGQCLVVVLFETVVTRHGGASTHIDFEPFTPG